jgi:ring-1,2-phenylacetyl-CoA epoxidase subunit PaaD
VSESGIHEMVARVRSGLVASDPPADRDEVAGAWAILQTVPDPELPVISVVDLGIIHRVEVDPTAIRVTMLPTFVGCPALDVIRASIEAALAGTGRTVVVEPTFEVPWTSDRISAAGRVALASIGIAPPSEPADVRCPRCASAEVVLDGLFGPTQCRSLYYCRGCRQPFEAMKLV